MRSMQITGLDELSDKLTLAGNAAQGIAKASLYEGAKIMADAMHASLNQIKTEPFRYVPEGGEKRLPSPQEKAAVLASRFGVAKHSGSGAEVDTVVGLSTTDYVTIAESANYEHKGGYVHRMGHKEDVPAAMLLRAIQSGTSFMVAQPVVRRAINSAKGAATAKIAAEGEARLQKIFND